MASGAAQDLARRLLGEFDTLGAVLAVPEERMARLLIETPWAAERIARFRKTMLHGLRTDVSGREKIADFPALLRLIQARIGNSPNEHLMLLFFDPRHRLIRDEIGAQGSTSNVGMAPRLIVTRALDLSAASLILAHNHPSGASRLSPADRAYTRELSDACRAVGVKLMDHIVVAADGHTSFREEGLL